MGAGFEIDVKSAAASASGSFFESKDLGVLHTVVGVSAFASFLASRVDDYGAHRRIR